MTGKQSHPPTLKLFLIKIRPTRTGRRRLTVPLVMKFLMFLRLKVIKMKNVFGESLLIQRIFIFMFWLTILVFMKFKLRESQVILMVFLIVKPRFRQIVPPTLINVLLRVQSHLLKVMFRSTPSVGRGPIGVMKGLTGSS